MRRTSVQIYKSDRGILKSRSFTQRCSAKKKTFKSNGIPLWLCPSSVAPPFHVPSVGTEIWVVRWQQCVELGGAGGGRDSHNSLNNLHFFFVSWFDRQVRRPASGSSPLCGEPLAFSCSFRPFPSGLATANHLPPISALTPTNFSFSFTAFMHHPTFSDVL